jgi:hypothetical protein
MLYGASRAQALIETHPNREHLLQVLKETKSEIFAGRGPGSASPSDPSLENPFPETESSSLPTWPSEEQDAYSSTTRASSRDNTFDENTLLSDDEINRQNQGCKSIVILRCLLIFLLNCLGLYARILI